MLRTIKRQAGGTATTKTGFKTTTKGTPVIIDGKTVYLSDEEYKTKYPTIATVSKKDPELYIKPPLKEVEVVAAKPSWKKYEEEALASGNYTRGKFLETMMPNDSKRLGITPTNMSPETEQDYKRWIENNYVAPKLLEENKNKDWHSFSDTEKRILSLPSTADKYYEKESKDKMAASDKLYKEKGLRGIFTPEGLATTTAAIPERFKTGVPVLDFVNPAVAVGDAVKSAGEIPKNIKDKDYKSAAINAASVALETGIAKKLLPKSLQNNPKKTEVGLSRETEENIRRALQEYRTNTRLIPGGKGTVDLSLPSLPLPLNLGSDDLLNNRSVQRAMTNNALTYNRRFPSTQNTDYTRISNNRNNTPNININNTERLSRELSTLNPNFTTLTQTLRTTNPTINLRNNTSTTRSLNTALANSSTPKLRLNEGKEYVRNLLDEANDVFKTNFESGKSNRHYFVDKTPNNNGRFSTFYIDENGVKVEMGEIKLTPLGDKQNNGAFHVDRPIDFTATKLSTDNPNKKGASYEMSGVFNELQKKKGVGLYSSTNHTTTAKSGERTGEERYLTNLLSRKVKVSDSFNDPFDVQVMNKELEKARKEFNLSSDQRPTREQIRKFKNSIMSDENARPSNSQYVRPSSIRYKYLKLGGNKYKYFL